MTVPAFSITQTILVNGYVFTAAMIHESVDSALTTVKRLLEQGISAYICPLTKRQVVIYIRKTGEQKT